MQCQDCKKRIYSPDKIIKYVSIILVNKHINEKSNYNEPYMWLSERINQNKPMYQLYNCPGGHMNEYESEEDALRRELKEETSWILWNNSELRKIGTITIDNNNNRDYGKKMIYVYELITDVDKISRIPSNTEPENLGPWKQFSFLEVLNLPVIDSIKYYICEKIKQLISMKHFLFIEGTIGAEKTTLIRKYFWNLMGYHQAQKWTPPNSNEYKCLWTKVIPEVTLSKRLEKDLKNFYEKKITPTEFQNKIEKEYFVELCKSILFDRLKEAIYILDRNQTSTYIFSKFSNIPNQEIKQLKKNREYFDELIKRGTCVFINSSRERVLLNKQMRGRESEKAMDIEYLVRLHDVYHWLTLKAYKPIIGLKFHMIDNLNDIEEKEHRKYLKTRIHEILKIFFDKIE